MQVFESLDYTANLQVQSYYRNYDGLHLGHRKIIERIKLKAREKDGTSMLMSSTPSLDNFKT